MMSSALQHFTLFSPGLNSKLVINNDGTID